jgi:hypothetical protein
VSRKQNEALAKGARQMNSKQFHNLTNGTKIQITNRSGDDVAQGVIVKSSEYTNRGSLVHFNKIKITEAASDSGWAKYVKRPAQNGFIIENVTVI